jgi:hypothetical protein
MSFFADAILRVAKCQGGSVAAGIPKNSCCNFVNENKLAQSTAHDNRHGKSPSTRMRTDLAENEVDTETGVGDLKSFVLDGTCGFDPHSGYQFFFEQHRFDV